MRILMLNWRCPSNPKSGGAEYVTRKHLEAWVLAGHEVHWLAGSYPGAPPYEKLGVSEITKKQFKESFPRDAVHRGVIHIHRYGTPIMIYFLAPLLYWYKWGGKFDLVIDQIHGIPFLTPLWTWKSRKIAFIHEVAQEIWDEMLPFPINVLGKIYEKVYFLFYRGIRFWTVSNSTKKDLAKFGILKEQITVIPNAIDLEPVKEVPTKENVLTLVFLGRLVKMKGIEDALRIVTEFKKTVPEVKLWVLGQGEPKYIDILKHLTAELGISSNVDWKGWATEEEKVGYLRRAHYLLHTSVREGFGLTVLEANSQGTPAIARDIPGLHDIVHDKSNGILLDDLSVNDVLSKYDIKSREYVELCESSLKSSLQFTWEKALKNGLSVVG